MCIPGISEEWRWYVSPPHSAVWVYEFRKRLKASVQQCQDSHSWCAANGMQLNLESTEGMLDNSDGTEGIVHSVGSIVNWAAVFITLTLHCLSPCEQMRAPKPVACHTHFAQAYGGITQGATPVKNPEHLSKKARVLLAYTHKI